MPFSEYISWVTGDKVDASAINRWEHGINNVTTNVDTLLGTENIDFMSVGTTQIEATIDKQFRVDKKLVAATMRIAASGVTPAGSDLVCQVQHWTGSAWSTIATLTIVAGTTAPFSVTGLSTVLVAGNGVRLNFTSVGSTTAAKGVVVTLNYTNTLV